MAKNMMTDARQTDFLHQSPERHADGCLCGWFALLSLAEDKTVTTAMGQKLRAKLRREWHLARLAVLGLQDHEVGCPDVFPSQIEHLGEPEKAL